MAGHKQRRRSRARVRTERKQRRRSRAKARARATAAARKIPTHIVAEQILPRIPLKWLLRNHSLVCKEWLHLISSPRFNQIHLNISDQRRPRILLTVNNGFVDYEDAPDAICDPQNKIPFPQKISSVRIVGSCDGLICLFCRYSNKLFLFNPYTRKYAEGCIGQELSRSLSGDIRGTWFGRHPSTGEYTLVVQSGVYKLNSLNCYHLPIEIERGVCVGIGIGTMLHGTLHWPAMCINRDLKYRLIFGYDLRKNETVKIPIPEHLQVPLKNAPFTLGVVDECLFLISESTGHVFELWIMREYGAMESWTKFANIEGFEHYTSLRAPLGFSQNGDLIVQQGKRMLKRYSFRNRASSVVYENASAWYYYSSSNNPAVAYVESLVSPDQILHTD